MIICAHESGETPNFLMAAFPYVVSWNERSWLEIRSMAALSASLRALLIIGEIFQSKGVAAASVVDEGWPLSNAGSCNISRTSSHILAVGVPSMTECSPIMPASALSNTMNWTGLSTHRFRRPLGEELVTPPCQRSRL